MKMRTKKGFTLAELLIVIAIIAVLVAIAIPIFSSQLNSAKLAVDMANKRDLEAYGAMLANTGELTVGDKTVTVGNLFNGGNEEFNFYYCFLEDGSIGELQVKGPGNYVIPEGAYRAQGTETEGAAKHQAGDYLVLLINGTVKDGLSHCMTVWWTLKA